MVSFVNNLKNDITPNVAVVLLAAGQSTRMGKIDKIFAKIKQKEVISYSLSVFNSSPLIGSIILVTSSSSIKMGEELVEKYGFNKVSKIISGGKRRQDSVKLGLKEVKGFEIIMIHDGARPFINFNILKSGVETVNKTGASIPVIPLEDSIKYIDASGFVIKNIDRKNLYLVQTPQVFHNEVILDAHDKIKQDVTDDASMVELNNGKIYVFEGLKDNIKLTTLHDYLLAESIVSYNITSGDIN